MMYLSSILFLVQLQIVPLLNGARVKRSSCGTLHGCWAVPNGCSKDECTANLRWSVSGRGSFLRLRLEALLNDLPSYAMYIALGFSNDQHMGDDTVLECLYNGIDEGRAYLSYNDGTYNTRLYEATAILIVNSSFVVNDGTFTCLLDVNFKQLNLLSTEDKSRIHNILVHPYYLQFVRGSIDQYSYVKKMHSLSDGSLYPWTTETAINMPRNKDGKYENIENAQQVKWFSRRITYAMVTLHAILMIWSWWFFLSNAILISRYFKTFWPTVEIDHRPIWFQLHRGGALISIMLQTVAIFLIIIQSRFQLYLWCTRQCTIQHCMKPTHTWAGLNAYILAVMQTVIALNKFKWKFIKRFYFRWFHRFVAIVAFVAASSGILSATTLNKTGLIQNYGKWPILLVGLYLCTFSVVLFGFSFLDAYHAKKIAEKNEVGQKECIGNKNAKISMKVETDKIAEKEMKHKYCWIRIIHLSISILHVITSFAVCFIITAMVLINYTRKH